MFIDISIYRNSLIYFSERAKIKEGSSKYITDLFLQLWQLIKLTVSGSYDHTVKMWDSRTQASVMTVNHGYPVEDILVFPSGGLCASAGK